jgi:hypothetical protein
VIPVEETATYKHLNENRPFDTFHFTDDDEQKTMEMMKNETNNNSTYLSRWGVHLTRLGFACLFVVVFLYNRLIYLLLLDSGKIVVIAIPISMVTTALFWRAHTFAFRYMTPSGIAAGTVVVIECGHGGQKNKPPENNPMRSSNIYQEIRR